jgi:hypothetical protein
MESIPENLESLLRSLADASLEENKNSKEVRHSSGQVMRLLLNAKRTEQGYRGAEVLVGPSKAEEVYVAAVLALHGEEITERDWLCELLRYFRPELDDLSEKERIELLERTIGYANDYLKALRRLTAFLQYGEAGAYEGLATKRVTKAEKQVRAAEFRELLRTEEGKPLPYSKIGQLLGEKPTPGQTEPHRSRGYDARISRMVKAGRAILKQALGEESYRTYMEEKRAELEHWQTLSKDEQNARHMEENFAIFAGDGYQAVLANKRRSSSARG